MNRFDVSYMRMALVWSENSYCKRSKVGAILVKDNTIISDGYNGTVSQMSNNCEDEEGNTYWHVIHAEANAIAKIAKSNQSSIGATLYVTCSPCRECAKMLFQAGITRVVYLNEYRDTSGIEFLSSVGINVNKLDIHEKFF